MALWIAFAVMTAAAVLAVLWPLARGGQAEARAAGDAAIYRDQLGEIERDRARGLIGAPEAEAARIEVSRRLIAADAALSAPVPRGGGVAGRRRLAAALVVVGVPALGLGLYLAVGSPDLPDAPLAARMEEPARTAPLATLLAQVEQHLAEHPDDGRGWELLAPIYLRSGRLDEAKAAYGRALTLLGSTAQRETDFGEAATASAGRVVTAEAKAAFARALALEPKTAKARYYLGLSQEQDGDRAGAAASWRAALADVAPGSDVAAFLTGEVARVQGVPVAAATPAEAAAPADAGQPVARTTPEAPVGTAAPSAEQVAAASTMAPADRQAMIQGMVGRLADHLRQDGSDPEGWVRLMRAYMVLGRRDRAVAARQDADRALAGTPDGLKAVDAAARGLGLDG